MPIAGRSSWTTIRGIADAYKASRRLADSPNITIFVRIVHVHDPYIVY